MMILVSRTRLLVGRRAVLRPKPRVFHQLGRLVPRKPCSAAKLRPELEAGRERKQAQWLSEIPYSRHHWVLA
jgi:hypothetical protein